MGGEDERVEVRMKESIGMLETLAVTMMMVELLKMVGMVLE